MVHCLEYLTSLSKVTCPNPTRAETETLTVHPAEKRKYYLTNIGEGGGNIVPFCQEVEKY